MGKKYKCCLCGKTFDKEEMSDEHYPARNVGNDDVGSLDIIKYVDSFQSGAAIESIKHSIMSGKSFEDAAGDYFDKELSSSLYPKGRTAKTLCRECNTFLGKYDEAYLKFFKADGDPNIVKGFQKKTRLEIIKAIYGKFLSVPETKNTCFDFVDFVRDRTKDSYDGCWKLYFVHRDYSSDLMGMADLGTGMIEFDDGVVYELSDEKFIFNLMNFEKHDCYKMNNIFDLIDKKYNLITGVGEYGGYHGQILMKRLLAPLLNAEIELTKR